MDVALDELGEHQIKASFYSNIYKKTFQFNVNVILQAAKEVQENPSQMKKKKKLI